jgi:hypothetical protein
MIGCSKFRNQRSIFLSDAIVSHKQSVRLFGRSLFDGAHDTISRLNIVQVSPNPEFTQWEQTATAAQVTFPLKQPAQLELVVVGQLQARCRQQTRGGLRAIFFGMH